jgi:hypothetical protein
MSSEPLPFDSGAVLARATPVLTFSTEMRESHPRLGRSRERLVTPTPLPVTSAAPTKADLQHQRALPVIPRIVRRTFVDADGMFARAVVRATGAVGAFRRSVIGGLLGAAVLLAALGGSAGVVLRSLSDPALPEAAAPSPSPVPSAPAPAVATGGPSSTLAAEPHESASDAERAAPAVGARARVSRPARGAVPTRASHVVLHGRGQPAPARSDARLAARGKPKRAAPPNRANRPNSR